MYLFVNAPSCHMTVQKIFRDRLLRRHEERDFKDIIISNTTLHYQGLPKNNGDPRLFNNYLAFGDHKVD